MIWKSLHDQQIRKYDFSYDAVNRLTAANFTQYYNGSFNGTSGINYTANNLSYDANGNILSMNQYGLKKPIATSSQLIDQLTYTYLPGSNRLQKVVDAVNDSSSVLGDFKYLQKNKTDTDYVYDANGNLIADKNKNISNIAYNILNLPQTITVAGKGTITYTYDAVGNKLRKQTVEGSKTTTTLYGGNIVYENDTLQFISHEEGRTRVNNNNYVFDYYLKDHLGNVRMTITDDTTQPTPVIDATSYYPFGLTMSGVSSKAAGKLQNREKFNGGNELQNGEFSDGRGVELYDANFRMYDPQIGRFNQQDPLADISEDETPYSFASNNPIDNNDPLGLVTEKQKNTLPEVVVKGVRQKKTTITSPQVPQSISAGAMPLPLTPSPLTPVPSPSPVIPFNKPTPSIPPTINPLPEIGIGILPRLLGVIGALFIPTPTGLGADKVPHPFAPDQFPGHGNRGDNSNPHIVYRFSFTPTDGRTPVLKYGISDSYRYGMNRPESQLAGFRAQYGITVTMQVLTRTINRAAALFIEAGLVGRHVSQWGVMPREQKRPGGF